MARTLTERVDELVEKVLQLTVTVERSDAARGVEIAQIKATLADVVSIQRELQHALAKSAEHAAAQGERLKALEKHVDHPATLSSHDQRLKALEKGNDRLWQFAPIALATFALLVSIYSAFVKK